MTLVERLRSAGCVYAEDEAKLLVAEGHDEAHLERLVQRRVAGEPLEQVLGWAELDGIRLIVAPGVFVPRRRTLLLAHIATEVLPRGGRVLDLCCGVGPVAAVVARDRPDVEVHVADVDPDAVDCARANVPSATTHVGDLLHPVPSDLRFDVIVANAPYVPTAEIALTPAEAREHERRATLDGGVDGTAFHRRIAVEASERLCVGGHVLIETAEHLARLTAAAFESAGFATRTMHDDDLDATVVVARSPGTGDPI